MGETLWNKQSNYEELCSDYFYHLYGKDWEHVVEYLSRLSCHSSSDYFNAKGDRINPDLSMHYKSCAHLAESFLPFIEKNIAKSEGNQKTEWIQLGITVNM